MFSPSGYDRYGVLHRFSGPYHQDAYNLLRSRLQSILNPAGIGLSARFCPNPSTPPKVAFAYPEGECFFKRSALRSSTYDPDKPEHFYAHLLVEYIWNRPAFHGSASPYNRDVHYHPRSPYKVVKGDMWNTNYGNWENIFFLYGKKPHSDPARYRHVEHNLCVNGNRFRDQDKGGALESFFMIIPMPLLAKGEEWFLVDRVACIRGIYIPVAHQTSEDYPEVCSFLHVNFALTRKVNMLTQFEVYSSDRREYVLGEDIETFKLDATLGLAPDAKWTMAINIRQLVNLLSLPRPLRGHNCFSSHIIRMVDRKFTPTTGTAQKFTDGPDLSWTTVASANYGLSIQWTPPTPTTWLADFIKNSLTVAVGFIPVVGPLAAVCFPLTWTAIADPGNFEHTLRALVPVADLAMQVAAEVQKSAQEQVLYMPKGWAGNVENFRLINAADPGAQSEKKAAQPKVVSEETVKQFESVRKFKHWNVMRAVSAAVTSDEQIVDLGGDVDAPPPPSPVIVSGVAKEGVVHRLEEELPAEVPEQLPLRELQPSAPLQLATQVLQHSADASASTGANDDSAGRTVQEVCPETVIPVEQGPGDNFNWMDEYLREELS